jgi:carbamate kinase
MLIVTALGGNALLERGQAMTAANQQTNIKRAVRALTALIDEGHRLVITHGNGPQVGMLALQAAAAQQQTAFPLDVLDAESAGMIGYMIEQELRNALKGRSIATLLNQVKVDGLDPAFDRPTKFVGPVYDREAAEKLATEQGWRIAPDGGHWRRVVASPEPKEILGIGVIRLLLRHDVTVICAGGGGIPVVDDSNGVIHGEEAVIDKDLVSALLACNLDADMLLMLTDVDAVYSDFGSADAKPIRELSVRNIEIDAYPPGSMGPKIAAGAKFALATHKPAAIGCLDDALRIVQGDRGTRII